MFFFFAEAHHQMGLVDVILDFKSNVINWLILVGFVVYGLNKIVPPILAQRERSITEALTLAERTKKEADAQLLEVKNKIENAQKENSKILEEAETVAKQMSTEIAAQTKREVADLERKMEAAIANERQMIITEVRTAAVRAAMQLSREHLKANVSEADNKRLLTQFMQELDTLSSQGESVAPDARVNV